MKRIIAIILSLLFTVSVFAWERQAVWPKGKMPDAQSH